MTRPTEDLLARIRSTQARIGIIGLGYVGLPLAVEFANVGFDVTGFDVDEGKNGEINAGRSYITSAWWMTFFPGAAIVAVGMVATLAGRRLSARLAGRSGAGS